MRSNISFTKNAVLGISILLLVACGGKSRTAPPPVVAPPPPPPPVNTAPTASISADATTLEEGQTLSLSGSGSSDPDGDALTYEWGQTAGPTTTITDTTAQSLELLMPEVDSDESLTFELTVSDGSLEAKATIEINVQDISPTATIVTERTSVDEGRPFSLSATSSTDPKNVTLTYLWSQTAGSAVFITDPNSSTLNLLAPEISADETLTFQLTVTNGTRDASTAVDIQAENIVLGPVSTRYERFDASGLGSINRPTVMYDRFQSDTLSGRGGNNGFGGIGTKEDGTATLNIWESRLLQPGNLYDYPASVQDIPDTSFQPGEKPRPFTFITNLEFGSTPTNRGFIPARGIHFKSSEKVVFRFPSTSNAPTRTLDVPGTCQVAADLDTTSPTIINNPRFGFTYYRTWYLYTALTNGGIIRKPVSNTNPFAFGADETLSANGDFCDFDVDLEGNVVALDRPESELLVLKAGGGTTRLSYDSTKVSGLDTVSLHMRRNNYFENFGPTYLYLLFSDDDYETPSVLQTYLLERDGDLTFVSDHVFDKGTPVEVSFTYPLNFGKKDFFVRFSDMPQVAHFSCTVIDTPDCPDIQYLETGFGVTDVTSFGAFQATTDDSLQLVINKRATNEMYIWNRIDTP